MIWILPFFFSVAYAASFGGYYDSQCTTPISTTLGFTDVCTWSSNRYSGSWSLFLSKCSETQMTAVVYNASDYPTCQGVPNYSITITEECIKFENAYIRGLDFTCESNNNTYNVLAHFEPDCKDGGIPFSVQLGEGTCQSESFAPGLFNLDTQGGYSQPYYTMTVYNTTDGSCQDTKGIFETETFPAQCIPSLQPFQNISIDIYQAFPMYSSV